VDKKQREADWQRTEHAAARRGNEWHAIEFFAGIGGFAWAWSECPRVTAIDIDQQAREVYQRHWPHRYLVREIGALDGGALAGLGGNMWWLSPPCQPYSRRGRQRDIDDPRSAALLHLIALLPQLRPRAIALENVVGFAQSRARAMLEQTLAAQGYRMQAREICPTELGWPNRRPRFYLLACLDDLRPWQALPRCEVPLADLLRSADVDRRACQVSPDAVRLYGSAMDRVDLSAPRAVTACFGSSYGKSLLHAGSYIVAEDGWRRFSPAEVARLLGFPPAFSLPEGYSYRRAWKLLGNSLSIPVVRYVLSHLPDGPPT
jgi:site-specific DNA-cytosine methylase